MESRVFVDAHSDLRYRNKGMESYREGRRRDAFHYFRLASRYADKTSQALVGVMYWTGDGVAKDRALGYAWMDLAASRGYPELQRQRQLYMDQLSDAERAKAAAAAPHTRCRLRRCRRRQTAHAGDRREPRAGHRQPRRLAGQPAS